MSDNFRTCTPVQSDQDVTALRDALYEFYWGTAQYDYPPYQVNATCRAILGAADGSDSRKVLQQIVAGIKVTQTGCLQIHEDMSQNPSLGWLYQVSNYHERRINNQNKKEYEMCSDCDWLLHFVFHFPTNQMQHAFFPLEVPFEQSQLFMNRQIEMNQEPHGKSSFLQSCTEMVMPFCSKGGDEDMFYPSPWNLTQVSADCYKTWRATPMPKMADIMYGADDLVAASNIILRYYAPLT